MLLGSDDEREEKDRKLVLGSKVDNFLKSLMIIFKLKKYVESNIQCKEVPSDRYYVAYKPITLDGYYVAYKPITLSCILLMFIEMKFIHCHSCVMFAMKSMSMCND